MEDQSTSHKGQRLHSYDFNFKLKVINYAKEHGNHKAAKVYAVDRKRVREWRKIEESLKEMASKMSVTRKRRSCAGRKINFPHIEQELIQWLKARRESGVRVTGKSLKQEAIRQHRLQGNQSFKASCSWLRKFMKRHQISFRRATHVAQKTETELDDKMQGFLHYVINMRKRKGYELGNIGNMDETPVWIDMPGDYTIDMKGSKTVIMGSTGHEKTRLTVCLAAMADGTKLLPLVLLKGVRPPKDIPTGIVVKMTPKAWSDEEAMIFWLRNVWRESSTRRLLIWDSFSGHKMKTVKQLLTAKYNTDMAIIPGGCTSKLQPCDVSWNNPFKDNYRELYDEWLFNGPVSTTKAGNRRPPEKTLVLRWIKEAWGKVTPEIIRKSFLKTGIANSLDGTQDDLLFAASDDSDDEDPFVGFDAPTVGEQDRNQQLTEAVQMELDALNEWSEPESQPDDEPIESDYSDPGSPGN